MHDHDASARQLLRHLIRMLDAAPGGLHPATTGLRFAVSVLAERARQEAQQDGDHEAAERASRTLRVLDSLRTDREVVEGGQQVPEVPSRPSVDERRRWRAAIRAHEAAQPVTPQPDER